MLSVNKFRSCINGVKDNDVVYINSINLSEKSIEELRTYVKNGRLIPVQEVVVNVYKDIESVMNGEVILPQMDYIVRQTA
jgi:hypothetical protein